MTREARRQSLRASGDCVMEPERCVELARLFDKMRRRQAVKMKSFTFEVNRSNIEEGPRGEPA
jgi:hypothetical protein